MLWSKKMVKNFIFRNISIHNMNKEWSILYFFKKERSLNSTIVWNLEAQYSWEMKTIFSLQNYTR